MGAGTSKANTAILHTGFDATPGTLEASPGLRAATSCCSRTPTQAGIPRRVDRRDPGGLERGRARTTSRAAREGVRERRLPTLHRGPPRRAVPRASRTSGPGALGGAAHPRRGNHLPVHHAARVRHAGGADRRDAPSLGTRSPAQRPTDGGCTCSRRRAARAARALGGQRRRASRSDEIDRMFGHDASPSRPRRGELIVFDKLARPLVNHILLPVPTKTTKGVLVAPTVFGNVMLGPTADDLERQGRHARPPTGLARPVAERAARSCPR